MAVGFVGMLLLVGCGSDSDSESVSAGDEASLLFVQDADGGTLDGYLLTMIEVSPNTGWFTDRPNREAGQMSTADFVSLWDEGGTFADDPPNADLACQVDGGTVSVVVELSSPVVNGRTLSYDVVRVGDTPVGDFDCDGNIHLFIDGVKTGGACAAAQAGSLNLSGADLLLCNLTYADLTGADLTFANLTAANLSGAVLTGADLANAGLYGADVRYANLTDANLFGADLRKANLTGAGLFDANLLWANLTDANLTAANLGEANLSGGNADLTRANLTRADLSGADLKGVKGWDTVKGKDTILGLDTAKNVPAD